MPRPVVLLAEDEPVVRQLVVLTLQRENFVVLPACDAAEALDMFHSHKDVDVVLSDVQLGAGMNGLELVENILMEKPTAKALLISGFPDSEVMATEKGLPFLGKPFLPNVLVGRIKEVLVARIPAQSEEHKRKQRRTAR